MKPHCSVLKPTWTASVFCLQAKVSFGLVMYVQLGTHVKVILVRQFLESSQVENNIVMCGKASISWQVLHLVDSLDDYFFRCLIFAYLAHQASDICVSSKQLEVAQL